jgi:hypothetical protein
LLRSPGVHRGLTPANRRFRGKVRASIMRYQKCKAHLR